MYSSPKRNVIETPMGAAQAVPARVYNGLNISYPQALLTLAGLGHVLASPDFAQLDPALQRAGRDLQAVLLEYLNPQPLTGAALLAEVGLRG